MSLVRSTEISFYQQYLNLGLKVLDFGCGDGFFLETLRQFQPQVFKKSRVYGLDLESNSRVKQIAKNLYHKIDLYQGQKLPYQPSSFDNVIANCVFEHVPNLDSILKQLAKVLKPKGTLYTTMMTHNWNRYLRLPGIFWDRVQEHHHLLTAKQWQKQVEAAGFKVLKIQGYLNQQQSRLVEISHFTSVPYLISYLLLGRWDAVGAVYTHLVNQTKIKTLFSQKVTVEKAAGLFMVLQKQ